VKRILLTQGMEALVDDEDYELVSQYKWKIKKAPNTFYAMRSVTRSPECSVRYTTQSMHSFITGYSLCDHIDHNGLNNQRENLREATHSQNLANQPKRGVYTSNYKGVCWSTNQQKWKATISFNSKTKHLGLFDNEEDAARAYNRWAILIHGEFAAINDVESKDSYGG